MMKSLKRIHLPAFALELFRIFLLFRWFLQTSGSGDAGLSGSMGYFFLATGEFLFPAGILYLYAFPGKAQALRSILLWGKYFQAFFTVVLLGLLMTQTQSLGPEDSLGMSFLVFMVLLIHFLVIALLHWQSGKAQPGGQEE